MARKCYMTAHDRDTYGVETNFPAKKTAYAVFQYIIRKNFLQERCFHPLRERRSWALRRITGIGSSRRKHAQAHHCPRRDINDPSCWLHRWEGAPRPILPLTNSYAPTEKVAYYHRYARRHYRRGYRRGYYGYGYGYPTLLWLWLPPTHYGYGYRRGYGWRY